MVLPMPILFIIITAPLLLFIDGMFIEKEQKLTSNRNDKGTATFIGQNAETKTKDSGTKFVEQTKGIDGGQLDTKNVEKNPTVNEETSKWLQKVIELIEKQSTNGCLKAEENDPQNPFAKQFTEIKDHLLSKFEKKNVQIQVTRDEMKAFFMAFSFYLGNILDKKVKYLKKTDAYQTDFRLSMALKKEKNENQKLKKSVAKFEKAICPKHCKNIQNDFVDPLLFEFVCESFQKLQILQCLESNEKQNNYCQHFDIYYYQEKEKELKAEQEQLENAYTKEEHRPGYVSKQCCLGACTAFDEGYCDDHFHSGDPAEQICGPIASLLTLACCAPFCITLEVLNIGCCYIGNGGCVNDAKIVMNKREQKKTKKHLEQITPP